MPLLTENGLSDGSTIAAEPRKAPAPRNHAFSVRGLQSSLSGKTASRVNKDVCIDSDLKGPYQHHYVKLDPGNSTRRVLYSGHAGNRNPEDVGRTFTGAPVNRISGRHQPLSTMPTTMSKTCDYYDHQSAINIYSGKSHSYGNTDHFPATLSMHGGADVPNTIYSYLKQMTGLHQAAAVDEPHRTFVPVGKEKAKA